MGLASFPAPPPAAAPPSTTAGPSPSSRPADRFELDVFVIAALVVVSGSVAAAAADAVVAADLEAGLLLVLGEKKLVKDRCRCGLPGMARQVRQLR